MQCITEAQVEETRQTVSQMDPECVTDAMVTFSESQPNLLGFVMAFADDLGEEDAVDLSTYMLYVIYQMFRDSSDKLLPTVTEDQIKAQYEATCELLEGLQEVDPNDENLELEVTNQPYVYKYVSETLFEEDENGDDQLNISEEAAGEMFLLMKCVIDSIDAATN